MTLGDVLRAVAFFQKRSWHDVARIRAETERAALGNLVALAGHEVDDAIGGALVKLAGVRAFQMRGVARVFDDGDLHAETQSQIRDVLFAGVLRREDHALDAAVAEAARHENAAHAAELFFQILFGERFGVYPADGNVRPHSVARVAQRLDHGEIGVMQLRIFADERDGHALRAAVDAADHFLPLGKIRLRLAETELAADGVAHVRLFKHERRFIQHRDRHVLDDAVALHIAEVCDLAEDVLVLDRLVAAQHDDVRGNAHALQLLDGVLRRLGLVLARGLEIRHERHVDIERILTPDLKPDLPDGLEKRLALDIADRAADLGDDDIRAGLFADLIDELLDLVGDVRDDLHGAAEILAAALLFEHTGIHLARGEIRELVEVLVNEAFVVAEIEIGLRAVLGDVDLAVLVRAHRAGIDVDVGVELLRRDLEPARLQKTSERGGGDALAETGNHAAGDENVLCHIFHTPKG